MVRRKKFARIDLLSEITFKPLTTFIVGGLLGLVISVMIFAVFIGKLPSNFIDNRTISAVTKGLGDNYQYKVITKTIHPEISPSIIVWANDKDISKACFDNGKIDYKPIIRIFKRSDFDIFSLLPFFKQEYKQSSFLELSVPLDKDLEGDNPPITDFWVADVTVEDLNGDGSDEIIVKGDSFICGSSGNAYLFVFKDQGDQLELLSTIPFVCYYEGENLKEIAEKSEVTLGEDVTREILHLTADSYLEFVDLDKDGLKELVLGYPVWDFNNECHLCAHTWLIGVYKYSGEEFVIDNKWNSGLLYVTTKKISLADGLGYPNIERNFPFPLFGMYYFDCDFCDPFHNSTRKKSEILRIVEEEYD